MNKLSRPLAAGAAAIASRPRVANPETKPTLTPIPKALKMLSLGGLLLGGSLFLTPAAQAASIRACPTFQSVAQFILDGSCQAPDREGNEGQGDKIFTIDPTYTSSALNWRRGSIAISTDPIGSKNELYRLSYQRGPSLPWATNNNQFTLAYTIEIDPAFTDFEFSSLTFGVDVSVAGISSTSQIWTDDFNGSSPLLGTPLTLINGGTSPVTPIASEFPSIRKLYILNTITRTNTTGNINAFTNEFQQRELELPEPSMILGILAVAGIGAASRFWGK